MCHYHHGRCHLLSRSIGDAEDAAMIVIITAVSDAKDATMTLISFYIEKSKGTLERQRKGSDDDTYQ